jgi:hypothetical protein
MTCTTIGVSARIGTLAGAAWVAATVLLAMLPPHFVGLDQDAMLIFASDGRFTSSCMCARHLLGYPCH